MIVVIDGHFNSKMQVVLLVVFGYSILNAFNIKTH